MRVLITGGLGYVGGRLAQLLASQQGYELVLGSRKHASQPSWLPSATMVRTEWASPSALERICNGIDAIVHAAGMNAAGCAADPVAAIKFNAVATARLLKAAIRQGVKRFIYLSTAHVYGSPLIGAITEDTCPVALHPYATSHRAGEDAVRAAHQSADIEGIVVRLSNAYGAPANKEANCWMLLVNDLCRQTATTRRLVLRTAGLQRRDFITLTDVGRAIAHLATLPREAVGNGLFNVGGSWAPTVREMAELVASRSEVLLGFRPPISQPKPALGEISQPLIFRIDKLLGTGFGLTSRHEAELDAALAVWRTANGGLNPSS